MYFGSFSYMLNTIERHLSLSMRLSREDTIHLIVRMIPFAEKMS